MMVQRSFIGPPETIAALTIHQPYPSLICLPDEHPDAKRVENRIWETHHRGPIVIHAGASLEWLDTYSGPVPTGMPFSAIMGVADLLTCVRAEDISAGRLPVELQWLTAHKHVSGPWCWVLGNVRVLAKPIPYKGSQRIWRAPRKLVASLLTDPSAR